MSIFNFMVLITAAVLGVGALLTTTLGIYGVRKIVLHRKEKNEMEGRDAILEFSFSGTSKNPEFQIKIDGTEAEYQYKQRIGFIGQFNVGKTYLIQKLTGAKLNPFNDICTKGMHMIYNAPNLRVYFETQGLFDIADINNYEQDIKRDEAILSFLMSNSDTLVFVVTDLQRDTLELFTKYAKKNGRQEFSYYVQSSHV